MDEIIIAFDIDGTIIRNEGIHPETPTYLRPKLGVNLEVVMLIQILSKKMKNTKEGDGNLLDRCVILASSDTAEGLAHSINDYPILVAGAGGGALKHPGVHYRGNGTNTSDVLLTLLQAMDVPVTEFGKDGGKTTATVAAIRG